jgi:hypothetical protein
LNDEAANMGVLSINKDAVSKVYDDLNDIIQRTLRLARWRVNSRGGPNPIRSAPRNHFVWSSDGSVWKRVADCISLKLKYLHSSHPWTEEDADFLQEEILKGASEPLGHELLREADVNRDANPRSALVLGVAAAEVGFKHFVSNAFPETSWLFELPSPPLIEMLHKFPWEQLKLRINGKVPSVPELIVDELKKAITLRNKIVHSGIANLKPETLDSILEAVSDFLYFLDMLHGEGRPWAMRFIRSSVMSSFKTD